VNLKQQRAAALKAAQDIAEAAKAAGRDLTDDEQGQIESHLSEVASFDEQIERAEKSASLVSRLQSIKEPEPLPDQPDDSGAKGTPGTLGERFVKSEAFREFRKGHPSGVGSGTPIRIEAKGVGTFDELIGRKATLTTDTGSPAATREPGLRNYLPVDEPLTFLDLITTGSTNVSYSEYRQVVSETDNAAIVAEGDLKPLSDMTTDTAESKAFTYADGFDITNQTLADDGALAAFMESRIRRHVLGVVEDKILNGAGAGTEPTGILNTTGTLAQAFATDVITTLAKAVEKFEANNGNSALQAIVMNPADIWALRLLKDSNGNYQLGNPLQQGLIPTPWGAPLVRSNKVAAGSALVGRFDSVNFLTLEALNVLAFNQHKDYAQRNMVYVRAELRGRQLFYAPREVVVADLTV
jgi:HK97 family phage major capsid protein